MKVITLDLETSIKNRGYGATGDFKASPFCADNKVVMCGLAKDEEDEVVIYNGVTKEWFNHSAHHPVRLVGHNIGFDLLYLFKQTSILDRLHTIKIWDTQQVAYILSGHRHLYPSLNELAEELGLPAKPDKIKEYWDADIDTESIPRPLLEEYQRHDVAVTQAIYFNQLAFVCDKPELLNLIKVKMDDILCTTVMEWEGMQFDLGVAADGIEKLEAQLAHCEARIAEWADYEEFDKSFLNLATPRSVSALIFGGTLEREEDVPVLAANGDKQYYKTGARAGLVKTKKQKVEYSFEGARLTPQVPKNKSGFYPVDDEHLRAVKEELESHPASSDAAYCASMLSYLLDWREASKDISTYYKGYSALVWPDGKIHPNFNHCATRTGRQSCTKPNLQNVTKTDED